MSSFNLEIDGVSTFLGGNAPLLEILVDGAVVSSVSVSLGLDTYSFVLDYTGSYPSSLTFRFNSGSGDGTDTVSILATRVDGQTVAIANLSSLLLMQGDSTNVNTGNIDHLFGRSTPTAGDLGVPTVTGTGGADNLNGSNATDGDVIDAGGGDDRVRGLGSDDALIGGNGNDRIFGEGGNDIIIGEAGIDRIFGNDGDDLLYGGADNDRLIGGNGNDTLNGGSGDDGLLGDAGDDIMFGESGADFLIGGDGDDIMYGDDGADNISGGVDNDTIFGGDDNDSIDGGTGDDAIDGGEGDDKISGGDGDDVIDGEDGDDEIWGGADNDTINGMNDNDIVHGEGGNDILNGDAGNDTVVGGAGADTIDGGTGNDILHGHGLDGLAVSSILSANPNVVYNAETNSFYQLVTTNANISTARANASSSILNGVAGHLANITTQAENTYIDNMLAANTWIGFTDEYTEGYWEFMGGVEQGINFYNGATAGSALSPFYDSWNGGEPNDYNTGEDYAVLQTNGTWNDFGPPQGTQSEDYVIEWDAGLMADDNAIDTISGGDGNDLIYGYGGADVLNGDANDDFILGGTGADTIDGGTGNDVIGLANGDFAAGEAIDGGAGTDTLILQNATTIDFTTGTISGLENLDGSGGDDDVTIGYAQYQAFSSVDLRSGTDTQRVLFAGTQDVTGDTLPSGANIEAGHVVGSTGNDDLTITGTQLNSLIFGSGTINFNSGTDTLNITSTSTTLNALGATDGSVIGLENISAASAGAGVTIDMNGQSEAFSLTGSTSSDVLTGGAGNDTIIGQNGGDVITAGAGVDTISAGGNNDTINLANGDYAAGESIDGGANNDTIVLTNDTTIDFGIGSVTGVENLDGSTGNDDVTMGASLFSGFSNIDLDTGTDVLNVFADDSDISGDGTPSTSGIETGNLVGDGGNNSVTLTGGQLDAILEGSGTINLGGGVTDTINLTSTSADLNTLGATDGLISGVEYISAASAGAGVTIDLNGQTEAFDITGSGSADTITGGSGGDDITGGGGDDIIYADLTGGTITITDEDFEGGASGWSDNTTDNTEAGIFTEFLGRHQGNSGQSLSKTFTGLTNGDDVTISFNFYEIDSWDAEDFMVYLNDTEVIRLSNLSGSAPLVSDSGSFAGGTWSMTAIETSINNAYWTGNTWNDDANYEFTLTLPSYASTTLKLGFGSEADQGIADESLGIDNLLITQTSAGGLSGGDDTVDGGAGDDTIYGGEGSDVLNGGANDDTIYAYNASVATAVSGGSSIVTVLNATFDSDEDGFNYSDGFTGVGGGDGGNVTISGNYIGGDGNSSGSGNGSIEVDIDSTGNPSGPLSGSYSTTVTLTDDLSSVQLSLAYSMFLDSQTEAGEDLFLYVTVDGTTYGLNGDDWVDELNGAGGGGADHTTGWLTETLTIADLSAGSHTITVGAYLSDTSASNEDGYIRFDDISLSGTQAGGGSSANTQDLGETNVINGGSGSDTIYGSAGTDILNGDGGDDTIYSASADEAWDALIAGILASNAGVFYSDVTNSFYQFVDNGSNLAWSTANASANSATLTGAASLSGHLATITSQAENDEILAQYDSVESYWLGGSDAASEGDWTWVSGPENGAQFYDEGTNSTVNGLFEDWDPGQPNDSGGSPGQDYIYLLEDGDQWADAYNNPWAVNPSFVDIEGYLVEWDAQALLSTVDYTTIDGGAGDDTLYGNDGIDIFVYDSATWSGSGDVDTIESFSASGRDAIDISDLLTGYSFASDDIGDFVELSEAGGNTTIAVDANGASGGSNYVDVATLNGVTGLDLYQMIAGDNLIVS